MWYFMFFRNGKKTPSLIIADHTKQTQVLSFCNRKQFTDHRPQSPGAFVLKPAAPDYCTHPQHLQIATLWLMFFTNATPPWHGHGYYFRLGFGQQHWREFLQYSHNCNHTISSFVNAIQCDYWYDRSMVFIFGQCVHRWKWFFLH